MPANWSEPIIILGLLTAFVGVFLALFQMDGKRLIAYHTISQIGIILSGLGTKLALGAVGSLYHVLNHSIFKSLIFLSAGWVMWSAGTRDLRDIGKSKSAGPILIMIPYVVGALSISGIPPFNGFYSKSVIAKAVEVEHPLLAVLVSLIGMLTLLSFTKLGWYLFRSRGGEREKTVPMTVVVACGFLAIMCLVLGPSAGFLIRGLGGFMGAATVRIPHVASLSNTTVVGYIGSLLALVIWWRRERVYRCLTKGKLGFVGHVAESGLYFDGFAALVGRGFNRAGGLVSLSASGRYRDYGLYVALAWMAAMILVVGRIF